MTFMKLYNIHLLLTYHEQNGDCDMVFVSIILFVYSFSFYLKKIKPGWFIISTSMIKKISLSQCVDHNMEALVVQLRLHHHETYNLRYSSFIKWQGTKLIALVQPLIWLPIKVCWTLFCKEVHNCYIIPWAWPPCISLMALHEALMFSNLNAT